MTNDRAPFQLLIIGNGFDLQCGLKSSFSDFLLPRFIRLMKELDASRCKDSSFVLADDWGASIVRSGLTFWDSVLYGFSGIARGFTGSRSDSESLRQFLECRDSSSFLSWADVEAVIDSVVRHQGGAYCSTRMANQVAAHYCGVAQGERRLLLSGEAAYCYRMIGERASRADEVEQFMFSELEHFEGDLREYLQRCVDDNPLYEASANELMDALVHTELDAGCKERDIFTNVLSFNYTKLELDGLQGCPIGKYENVHGSLQRGDIIIGVDGRMSSPFSKTERRTKAGHTSDVSELALVDNGRGSPRHVDLIKVFGHSVNLADYYYYQELFDRVGLLESDVKIVFYLYGLNGACADRRVETVRDLFSEYGYHLGISDPKDFADYLMSCGRVVVRDSSYVSGS